MDIGLILPVSLFVRYAFLRTRYLKNRLRYEVDIWYKVFLLYEDVLINFKKECIKYCQSYCPFVKIKFPLYAENQCVEP